MKKIAYIFIVMNLLWLTGRGSSLGAAGAGTGVGAALQHTIAGAKADLERQEQELIIAYNEGVTQGMEVKDLDQIKLRIQDVRLARQGVDTGEHLLGVDWSQPEQTGGALGLVVSLGLLVWQRFKLKGTEKQLVGTKNRLIGTEAGINKFTGTHDPKVASELHDTIVAKVNEAKAG